MSGRREKVEGGGRGGMSGCVRVGSGEGIVKSIVREIHGLSWGASVPYDKHVGLDVPQGKAEDRTSHARLRRGRSDSRDLSRQ